MRIRPNRRRLLRNLIALPMAAFGVALLTGCEAPGRPTTVPTSGSPGGARLASIGVLHLGQQQNDAPVVVGLREGLLALGYVEGRDVVLEIRAGQGQTELTQQAARELVSAQVRLIVAAGTVSAQAAQQASGERPIVFTQVGDPVAAGFVRSLAQPGGSMTGFSHQLPATSGKRLELLRELAPAARRVTVVYDPTNPSSSSAAEVARAAADKLGLRLQEHHIKSREEVLAVLRGLDHSMTDAILVLPDSLVVNAGDQIIEAGKRERLPVMFHEDTWVRRGGLASYGASFVDLGRLAATYVDKILRGARPADLPVQQAGRFELVLNMRAAEELGLSVPAVLLALADEVVR